MSVLVIDVGTSGLRAAVVDGDGDAARTCTTGRSRRRRRSPGSSSSTPRSWPRPCSTWPATALADAGSRSRRRHHQPAGLDDRVGPRHRRAGRARPRLAGPAHGRASASRPRPSTACALAPNQSATKVAWLLDTYDPDREPRPVLRHGRHVDRLAAVRAAPSTSPTASNAAVTGLLDADGSGWRRPRARRARRARWAMLPTHRRLERRRRRGDGAPRRAADRAASSATSRRRSSARAASRPGGRRSRSAPAACSTCAPAPTRPASASRSAQRHVPDRRLAPRRRDARGASRRSCCRPARTSSGCATTSALIDDRGRAATTWPRSATTPTASSTCRRCSASARPHWDYGARGTLLGLTRGSGRPQIVRAVLEGVAHRGADLVEAAEADTGVDHRRRCGSTAG